MILCSPCNVKGSVTGWKFLDDFSFAMKIQDKMCRQPGQPWFQQPKQDQNEYNPLRHCGVPINEEGKWKIIIHKNFFSVFFN